MTVPEAVTLIAAIASAIVAIGGVAIGWRNAGKLDTVHTIVNSQAAKFEGLSRAAGYAEGQATSTKEAGLSEKVERPPKPLQADGPGG